MAGGGGYGQVAVTAVAPYPTTQKTRIPPPAGHTRALTYLNVRRNGWKRLRHDYELLNICPRSSGLSRSQRTPFSDISFLLFQSLNRYLYTGLQTCSVCNAAACVCQRGRRRLPPFASRIPPSYLTSYLTVLWPCSASSSLAEREGSTCT